jgi:hypothetical protein
MTPTFVKIENHHDYESMTNKRLPMPWHRVDWDITTGMDNRHECSSV